MKITVETTVNVPIQVVWKAWTTPHDIMQWNAASEDWHTPSAKIDLREGGEFCYRMEARDGSMGFDFEGKFTRVIEHELIEYAMEDGREVRIEFQEGSDGVVVREAFDAESTHEGEQQRQGWQAILNNFAKHAEAKHLATGRG
mgnify:CR=1 FL=1